MTGKIAQLLLSQFSTLNWVDKTAGVVKPLRVKIKGGEEKIYPVALNTSEDACDTSTYTDLVPDSSKMSILYFEDEGSDVIESGCKYTDIECSLKLVCWLNLPKINADYTDALNIKLDLINNIPAHIANTDWVTKIRVMFEGEEPKSAAIFSEYTYDEAEHQYLIYPYDFFALNYRVKFSIPMSSECLTAIVIDPSAC